MEKCRNKERIMSDGQAVESLTQEEIRKPSSDLKNGKAEGKDGIPVEFLKAASVRLYEAILYKIIVRIWAEEKMPEE